MMRVLGVGAFIAVAVAGTPAHADECIQPGNARVFASASGGHIFRVPQKDRERPEGTLVAIRDNFDERRVWRTASSTCRRAFWSQTTVNRSSGSTTPAAGSARIIRSSSIERVDGSLPTTVSKTFSAPPISVGTFTSRWRAGTGPRGRVSRSALMTPRWSSRSTGGGSSRSISRAKNLLRRCMVKRVVLGLLATLCVSSAADACECPKF
jgi:hypothetical protein